MERAVFRYNATDKRPLPHREVRWAMSKGRSVVVEGFTLGESEDDKAILAGLRGATFPGRVRFERCIFLSFVDLAEARFEQTLHLVNCEFREGLRLHDASVAGRCSLRGSTLCDDKRLWLDWRGLKTGADLRVQGVISAAPIDISNARIGADLRLDGLHVEVCGRTKEEVSERALKGETGLSPIAADMADKALSVHGAIIEGHVLLEPFTLAASAAHRGAVHGRRSQRARLMGQCDLRARIGGQVSFDNATVDAGTQGTAVQLNEATVGKSVFFIGGTRFTGAMDLRASVGGQVNFDNATVDAGTQGTAVQMDLATVGGAVLFRGGTHVKGAIDLRANVEGNVEFVNATVDTGTDGTAVLMYSATVGGAVLFLGGTRVTGAIDLRASVEGDVAFDNATVDAGPGCAAVDMQAAKVNGAVFIRGCTVLRGDLDFFEATLRSGLSTAFRIDTTEFDRPDMSNGDHRVARQCLITGNLDLGLATAGQAVLLHGLSVLGEIKARHLKVAGDLHLCGGVVGAVDDANSKLAHSWIELTDRVARLRRRLERHREAKGMTFNELWRRSARLSRGREAREARMGAADDALGWQAWELKSTPKDPIATAIDLELAHIKGHLWIRGQRVRGGVNASLARIEGDAMFDRSRIDGDLDMRDATINGELAAKPAVNGEPAPLVHGVVDGRGLTAESIRVRVGGNKRKRWKHPTDFLFDGATTGSFRASGWVHTERSNPFSMHRMRFNELDVEGLHTDPFAWFSWRDGVRLGGGAVLLWVVVVALWAADRPDGWRLVHGIAGGYVFALAMLTWADWATREGQAFWRRRLTPIHGATTRRPVLDFLDMTRFSAAFHIDVERWARASGDDPLADEAFLIRRRRELRERRPRQDGTGRPKDSGKKPGYRRVVWLWRWIVLDFVFGYGVRPARAIHLFLVLWLLNWAVFLPAAAVERPVSFETQAVEAGTPPDPANPAWPSDGGAPGEGDHWGPQRAFFMAMRVQVPPVELFVDAEWKPADRAMFGGGVEGRGVALTYENYAAIMRILNLILVPVIIAGATGLLKPREARYTGAN